MKKPDPVDPMLAVVRWLAWRCFAARYRMSQRGLNTTPEAAANLAMWELTGSTTGHQT